MPWENDYNIQQMVDIHKELFLFLSKVPGCFKKSIRIVTNPYRLFNVPSNLELSCILFNGEK